MITIYGIKNCETIKKTLKWFQQQGHEYQFHDYKKRGLNEAILDAWIGELGYEKLLNTRGTTWRKLPTSIKENIDATIARQIMLDNLSIIKRPVVDFGECRIVGFNIAEYRLVAT